MLKLFDRFKDIFELHQGILYQEQFYKANI